MNVLKTLWKIGVVNHKTTLTGLLYSGVNYGYDYLIAHAPTFKENLLRAGVLVIAWLCKDGDAPTVQQPKV